MEDLNATFKDACRSLKYGKTKIYELMNTGKLEIFKEGRCRRIKVESLHAYHAER